MEREEALKIIEANCRCSDSKLREACAFFIPELKESEESEDERIKKAIKYGLDYVFTNNTTVYETTKELCLAWLEKQGEHANFRNKIQIGDKVTRNRDGMLVNLSQLNRVAKKDENQEYQKPADKVEPKFKVGNKIYLKPEYRMPNDDTPIANTVFEIRAIDDKHYRFDSSYIFIEDQDKYELVEQKSAWKQSDEHYELEEFAKIVRSNLTGISKAVQELFEAKYLQLTGNKMYGGFKD